MGKISKMIPATDMAKIGKKCKGQIMPAIEDSRCNQIEWTSIK